MDRYHRQTLLPQVGAAGQRRLADARVVLIGVGALGCPLADLLVRAGVGQLTVVDRDVVERTNLQRQTLFAEADVGAAKAEAAARRLRAVNSEVKVVPVAADVDTDNLAALADGSNLILDGTDNAAVRYLVNDYATRRGVPWVYGACVGVEGRAFGVVPGGPCLRCVFPQPPGAGEAATCDTAGVLGPVATLVASVQATVALQLLIEGTTPPLLHVVEGWPARVRTVDVTDGKRPDCPCCGERRFEFLTQPRGQTKLCGRHATQVKPPTAGRVDLDALAARLAPLGDVARAGLMVKLVLRERPELALSIFGDGRMLVFGTEDGTLARALYARLLGG